MKNMFKTLRLQLIPFQKEDIDILHQTFTNPYVRQYLWDDEIIPQEVTQDILKKSTVYFENNSWGLWKIVRNNDRAYVGFVGLWIFFDEQQPQLLFGLLPEFSGVGYATEAAQKIVQYAFEILRFPNLIASFDNPNVQSEKVCQRLGMKWKEERMIDGKPITFYHMDKN
jgi:[ribosomal protein S5]-alanine N-acetyltransferase